jgi:hypothetical protein
MREAPPWGAAGVGFAIQSTVANELKQFLAFRGAGRLVFEPVFGLWHRL